MKKALMNNKKIIDKQMIKLLSVKFIQLRNNKGKRKIFISHIFNNKKSVKTYHKEGNEQNCARISRFITGHIDNLENLGNESITAKFEK